MGKDVLEKELERLRVENIKLTEIMEETSRIYEDKMRSLVMEQEHLIQVTKFIEWVQMNVNLKEDFIMY